MNTFIIFNEEPYYLNNRKLYSRANWVIYADEIAKHFECAVYYMPVKEAGTDYPFIIDLADCHFHLEKLPFSYSLASSLTKLPISLFIFVKHIKMIRNSQALLIRVPSITGIIMAELGRALGKKPIIYVGGNVEDASKHIIKKGQLWRVWLLLAKLINYLTIISARNSLVIALGSEMAEKFTRGIFFFGTPAKVINHFNPMFSEKFLYHRKDTCQGQVIRLLRVCHLQSMKGIEILLESLGELIGRRYSVRLDIVGSGEPDYVRSLEYLVERLNLSTYVKFWGSLPYEEVMAFYRDCDIQVISSSSEGIPRVIFEGWASSLPLVATAVGGIPGIVVHEHNGLLVSDSDSQALADAIERVIQDNNLRQTIIKNGFTFAREHSREKQAERLAKDIKKFAMLPA